MIFIPTWEKNLEKLPPSEILKIGKNCRINLKFRPKFKIICSYFWSIFVCIFIPPNSPWRTWKNVWAIYFRLSLLSPGQRPRAHVWPWAGQLFTLCAWIVCSSCVTRVTSKKSSSSRRHFNASEMFVSKSFHRNWNLSEESITIYVKWFRMLYYYYSTFILKWVFVAVQKQREKWPDKT